MGHVAMAKTCLARNNLRSMTKGDLAFFYHSNCKVPGVVGIMEIVEEHSVDGKYVYFSLSCTTNHRILRIGVRS